MIYTEMRCPSKDKHEINGVSYDLCGNYLCSIDTTKDCNIIGRCPKCGFWNIKVIDGIVSYKKIKMKYGERLEFTKSWRIVHGDE